MHLRISVPIFKLLCAVVVGCGAALLNNRCPVFGERFVVSLSRFEMLLDTSILEGESARIFSELRELINQRSTAMTHKIINFIYTSSENFGSSEILLLTETD
jgi:hypothetical protein